MKKEQFTAAHRAIREIENLISKAEDLFHSMPLEIRNKTWDYHRHYASLGYCLRWGQAAARDIREDWHNVVSELEVTE